jgi:hypothetical protein
MDRSGVMENWGDILRRIHETIVKALEELDRRNQAESRVSDAALSVFALEKNTKPIDSSRCALEWQIVLEGVQRSTDVADAQLRDAEVHSLDWLEASRTIMRNLAKMAEK